MRVLVTGAGGFVGGHMVSNLLDAGHEVVAATRRRDAERSPGSVQESGSFSHSQEFPGAKRISFDLRQAVHVKEAIDEHQPDAIVHLAAQASVPASWKDPNLTYRVNVMGASNILEALRDAPDTRVLLVGSAQQYGSESTGHPLVETDPLEPTSPYALSKVAQEMMGRLYFLEFGRPVMMTRTFNHTGPGQSPEYVVAAFCNQLAEVKKGSKAPRLEVGRLDSVRDFLDVRDVANAYRLLIEEGEPGEVYNVCSGEGWRIGDILKMLIDEAGLTSTIEVVEDATPRAGDPDQLVGDNSKLRKAISWKQRIPMQKSLADTLASYIDRSE